MGKGRKMGRSVYEQPGNEVDRILSQQGGFQVSKGRQKGSNRESNQSKIKIIYFSWNTDKVTAAHTEIIYLYYYSGAGLLYST
jgi:hypothetical protein